MFVKQIGMEEALRLASKGREIMVMAPGLAGKNGWTDYMPYTLSRMLEGCMFFREEPAAEVWDGLEAGQMVSPGIQEKGAVTLEGQVHGLPEAPKDRPPDVWMPVKKWKNESSN